MRLCYCIGWNWRSLAIFWLVCCDVIDTSDLQSKRSELDDGTTSTDNEESKSVDGQEPPGTLDNKTSEENTSVEETGDTESVKSRLRASTVIQSKAVGATVLKSATKLKENSSITTAVPGKGLYPSWKKEKKKP